MHQAAQTSTEGMRSATVHVRRHDLLPLLLMLFVKCCYANIVRQCSCQLHKQTKQFTDCALMKEASDVLCTTIKTIRIGLQTLWHYTASVKTAVPLSSGGQWWIKNEARPLVRVSALCFL